MILVGIILGVYAFRLAFKIPPILHDDTLLDVTHLGTAAIALLTAGALLRRAQAADETAKTEVKAEQNQRLARAVELMAAMNKERGFR